MIRPDFIRKKECLYSDVREQKLTSQTIKLENNSVKINSIMTTYLIGFRVHQKRGVGMSYTTSPQRINDAFNKAFKLSKLFSKKSEEETRIHLYHKVKASIKPRFKVNPIVIPNEEKIRFLRVISKELLTHEKVKNASAALSIDASDNVFNDSQGSHVSYSSIHSRLQVVVTMKDGDKIQQYFYNIGKQQGWEFFEEINPYELSNDVVNKCEELLYAKHAPAGKLPVVIDPRLAGVFFHEAVGHACEADLVLENNSVFKNKLGSVVASELVNLNDNPKVLFEYGSYDYDSEGVRARKTPLIRDGRLVGFLHSRRTAAMMNTDVTGNGRSSSPKHPPIPRMSNIELEPGDYSVDELFEGVKKGVLVKGSRGGVVEPTKGYFLFSAKRAYLIERGEITTPLREVSLSGRVLQVLPLIDAVSNKSECAFTGSYCGKKGQYVPVGESCPYVRVSEVIVGGRS